MEWPRGKRKYAWGGKWGLLKKTPMDSHGKMVWNMEIRNIQCSRDSWNSITSKWFFLLTFVVAIWLTKVKYNSALDASRHTLSTAYWENIFETSLPTFVHFWVTEVVLSRHRYYCNVFEKWKSNSYFNMYSWKKACHWHWLLTSIWK